MMKRIILRSAALALLSSSVALADEKVDFTTQIQPILVEHCATCHGAEKAQGKMRLHTAAAIQEKIAADPKLLVASEPDNSELYQRITLPEKNPKRMPKGADPLPKEAIELIANWIRQGAIIPAVAAAAPSDAPTEKAAESDATVKPVEPPPLPDVPAAPKEALDRLTAANVQVMPLFGGSPLLQISFTHRDQPAGDADIALLAGVADQVYALNLAGAKVTNAGLAPLADLKHLSALHLEHSAITDEGLAHLAGLTGLEYLNLYGTSITDSGLKHLAGLKNLKRLYLWQTKVSYDAAMALEKDTPELIVNLGYNHPVVAKMRLTKEMEVAKKQADDAKAEAAKVAQQLEAAKKNEEAANARVAEIDKELKALESPADKADDKAGEKADDKGGNKPDDKKADDKPADDKSTDKAEDKKAAEKADEKPAEKPAAPADQEKKN